MKSIPMSCKTYDQLFISKSFQKTFLNLFKDFKNMSLIGRIIPMKNFVVNIRNAILHYNGGVIIKEINHNSTFLKINTLKNLS